MTLLANRQRLLAALLFVAALIALEALVIAPLAELYADGQRKIAGLAMRASHVSAQRAGTPELMARLADLQRSGRADTIFWPGATDEVAAAGLQEKMRSVVQEAGASIDEAESLPSIADGTLRRISLKVRFSADIDQVERIVHAAESLKPALVIERLAIRSLNSTRADAPELAVELQVFGLTKTVHSSGPSA